MSLLHQTYLVREQAVGLIMWLRPKGLKVYSYVEKYAEFKIEVLKKSIGTQKCYARRNTPGVGHSQISTEMGYPIPPFLLCKSLHPRTVFRRCQIVSLDPMNEKKCS